MVKIDKNNVNQKELYKYFPEFKWVLRDFGLDLKGKTPN